MPLTKILYAEDYKLVAHYMKEILEMEGWHVDVCTDGLAALEKIESDTVYDLFLFSDRMPRMNGIELIERTRGLPHRKQTPIIILSASNCEAEARHVGANVFLKKPEDFRILITTITRLLPAHK